MNHHTNPDQRERPWLIAAWPGLGSVGALAGGHLVNTLQAKLAETIPERDFFSVEGVVVDDGIASAARLPRSMFFRYAGAERDIYIFLGEAQPASAGYEMCHRVMDFAEAHGVELVLTFAASATQMHPTDQPRVFAAATSPKALQRVDRIGVERMSEGQIGGLNGSMLAAAQERGVDAIALLGEIPFFAGNLPNPKASHAIIDAVGQLADLDIDTARLEQHAKTMEPRLIRLLEHVQSQIEEQQESMELDLFEEDTPGEPEATTAAEALDPETRQYIESLFKEAIRSRDHAIKLKAELDRLGVFQDYENRFLDLFKKAG